MRLGKHNYPIVRTLIATAISACFAPLVFALPVAPTVANGSATFAQNGNLLTVTNSNQAIINWQSFSIGSKETTRFVQPSANSSVLNRVLGNDPSLLLGTLQSNGRVFLINPAGILVGQGARVDVAGFAASTLNLADQDFLAKRLRFSETPGAGKVQNLGEITTPSGGNVYLVAPQVENNGIISAANGEVLLAAGQRVELIDTASPGVRVEIVGTEGNATNLGHITAEAGRIGIAGVLVKNGGALSASSVISEGGRIFLKASGDTLLAGDSQVSATGTKGGSVEILGNRVALTDNARVDASGQSGGGTVLVGGDYQGKNSAIQNSQVTYFGPQASLKADAISSGDGGKIVVWADDTTRVYGSISARGGVNAGNGGFVETSGKRYLDVLKAPDTSAARGKGGTWLLDPENVTIAAGADPGTSVNPGGTPAGPLFQPATTGSSTLSAATLTSYLVNTGDAIVDTTCASACGTTGNITVDATISPAILLADRTLTLKAHNDIVLNAGIDATGGTKKLHVTLLADQNNDNSGAVSLNNVISTNGGDVNITAYDAVTFVANQPITTSGGQVNITVKNTAASINMPASSQINSGGGVVILKADNMFFTSSSINAGSGAVTLTPSTTSLAIELGAGATDAASTRLGLTDAELKMITTSGTLTLGASGNSGAMTLAGALDLTSGAGLTGPLTLEAGSASFSVSSPLTLPNKLSIVTGGTLTSSAAMTASGDVSLKADKMALAGGTVNVGANAVTLKQYTSAAAIDVGTGATDLTASTIELSTAELNTITAGTLRIGDASSGAIDLKSALIKTAGGALEHVSNALNLTSGAAITQQAGATVAALPVGLNLSGSAVTMQEANPIGLISGTVSSGDFLYRSTNKVTVAGVDGVNGISAGANIVKLQSDSTEGINQLTGKLISSTGGLALKTVGPVSLSEANTVSKIAADLDLGATGSGGFLLNNADDLEITTLLTIAGIKTNNNGVSLSTAASKTLTITDAISTGTGANKVLLEADTLVLSNTVTTGGVVDIRPNTPGRKITVGSTTCNSIPCLNVANLWKIAAPTIAIGTDNAAKAPGAIHVDAITVGGTLVTDRNSVTTRIGLLTGAGVTQTSSIWLQDLGISAGATVNLNAANNVSNLAGKTTAGSFTFVNATGFSVAQMSGGVAPYAYSLSGISTAGGNVSLTASAGNISLAHPISAGSGAVSLAASSGNIQDDNDTSVNDVSAGALTVSASGTISLDAWGITPTVLSGTNGIRTTAPVAGGGGGGTAAADAAAKAAADAAAAKAAADAAAAKATADAAAAASAQAAADAAAAQAVADAASAQAAADAAAVKAAAELVAAKVAAETVANVAAVEVAAVEVAAVESVVETQNKVATTTQTPLTVVGAAADTKTSTFSNRTIGGSEGQFGAPQVAAGGTTTSLGEKIGANDSSDGGSSTDSKSSSDTKADSGSKKEGSDDVKNAKKKPAQCTA